MCSTVLGDTTGGLNLTEDNLFVSPAAASQAPVSATTDLYTSTTNYASIILCSLSLFLVLLQESKKKPVPNPLFSDDDDGDMDWLK